MGQCGFRIPGVTEQMGEPVPVEIPSSGWGKLIILTEPRRKLSAQVTINLKAGQSGDCSPPDSPEKDWNTQTLCHPWQGQNGYAHDWATDLRAAALERTVG